jgi:flagellar hook assembly protein FlgD
VGIEESSLQTPSEINLSQNYPNPFNSSTVVEFTLASNSPINLSIYDISGRRVKYIDLGALSAGTHRITWDGRGNNEQSLSSGIYFCKLKAGHTEQTLKMALLR